MMIKLNEQEITKAIEQYVRNQCVDNRKSWNIELIELNADSETPYAEVGVLKDDSPRSVPCAPMAAPRS